MKRYEGWRGCLSVDTLSTSYTGSDTVSVPVESPPVGSQGNMTSSLRDTTGVMNVSTLLRETNTMFTGSGLSGKEMSKRRGTSTKTAGELSSVLFSKVSSLRRERIDPSTVHQSYPGFRPFELRTPIIKLHPSRTEWNPGVQNGRTQFLLRLDPGIRLRKSSRFCVRPCRYEGPNP